MLTTITRSEKPWCKEFFLISQCSIYINFIKRAILTKQKTLPKASVMTIPFVLPSLVSPDSRPSPRCSLRSAFC